LIKPSGTVRNLFAKEKLRLVQPRPSVEHPEQFHEQSLLTMLSRPTNGGQRRSVIRIIRPAFFLDDFVNQKMEKRSPMIMPLSEGSIVPGIYTSEQFGDLWEMDEREKKEIAIYSQLGYRNIWIKPAGKPRNIYAGEILSLNEP